MMKRTKTTRLLGSLKEKRVPIGTNMFLPNHSGVSNHREITNISANHPHQDVTTTAEPEWAKATIAGIPYFSDDTTNLFIGTDAGANNAVSGTEGTGNYFIGTDTGGENTSGNQNFAMGAYALQYNQTGVGNFCLGKDAGLGVATKSHSWNCFIGYQSGLVIETGHSNVGVGTYTLRACKAGTDNVVVGRNAGLTVTGNSATYIGSGAGQKATAGTNVAIGRDAHKKNVIGTGNVVIGYLAGSGATGQSNYRNVFIGQQAGTAITTGDDNVCYGYQSGLTLTTGNDNIIIGSGVDVSAADVDNELNIGNTIFGDTSTGDVNTAKCKFTALGGYCIKLTNKTGANSVIGEVVIASAATTDAVALTGINSLKPIGVFLETGIADGSEAWIVVSGIARVRMDAGGCTRGDRIIAGGTAGRGTVNNAPAAAVHFQEIGHAVETVAANSWGRCVLHFN